MSQPHRKSIRSSRKVKRVHSLFRNQNGDASASTTVKAVAVENSLAKETGIAAGASIAAHLLILALVSGFERSVEPISKPVTVKIVTKEVPVIEPKKEVVPPPKPKPKQKQVTTERKAKEVPRPNTPPVQGLSAEALSPDGKGISAPIGNTLMTEDEGKRLKAEEVKPIANQDLTADARLIRSSVVTPTYTDDAVDAGLEGTFTVDVFVDTTGLVTSVELTKKVGYGMDEKLVAAAKAAKFEPRLNKFGKSEAGWSTITFQLELP